MPRACGGTALTAHATPALRVLAALGLGCLVIALVAGRPDVAALGAGLLAPVVAGLAGAGDPAARAQVELPDGPLVEGEPVDAIVVVTAARRVARLEVGLSVAGGVLAPPRRVVAVPAGATARVVVTLRPLRWGRHRLGAVRLRAEGDLGLIAWTRVEDVGLDLAVYPSAVTVRSMIVAARARHALGELPARPPGDGTELADVRPAWPGERLRDLHARQSARRGTPIVAQRHPERSAEVVLLLDTFSDAGASLERAVRGVAALAAGSVRRHDRVGLVTFGGGMASCAPATGLAMLHRVIAASIRAEAEVSYAWPDVALVPRRVLPPRALVLAVSPLLDRRMVATLADLRRRGHDVAVVEVMPRPASNSSAERLLAERLWRLERATLRRRLARSGIAVGVWEPDRPLDEPMAAIARFRRHALRRPVAA
jgi:uncharacterized protein (DUF58 family)